MPPLTQLATAATSNGLLTGQILFSLAFVGSCELPNWSGSCGEFCVSVWMPAASAWLNCAFNWTRSTSPVRQRCSAPQNGRQSWSSWSHCSHRSMR